ncbi:MAG TPA: condensin subunit MukF [Myxococcota bacterium]|nr:condensin subunit MukF [Myxococcota bacterium]
MDPSTLVAALSRDQVSLQLSTFDLCCLAGLYLRADRDALASFDEDAVVDLFEQVCDMVEPGADNPRKRATHAIQRLRDQRMLARVDGAGVVRTGEYAITRLAAAVVEYFLADEALTRESLTLLTRTLLGQLAEVKGEASRAETPEAWRDRVVGPLRVTVGDLVGGIERRQRGLDVAQEQVQQDIAGLLQADWFGAVDEAQNLLDTTTTTLAELNEVLLRDTHQFVALLQEVNDLAEAAGVTDAQAAAQRVIEQVDRIAVWGEARQRAWSDYYQYVHRYLRDVVRLDPDRALSQRLRDQLAGWTARPFHLVLARAPSIRLLRDASPRVDRPVVTRPRTDRERPPDDVSADDGELDIDALVLAALEAGAVSLSEVTAHVLAALPEARRFAAAGRVAARVAGRVHVRSERERPWIAVAGALEVEQWSLARREA